MYAGRIYADFQNLDDENRVRLDCAGTQRDLAASGVRLASGLLLPLYTDDADDEGNADPLLADATVELSESESMWVAKVDWSAVRRASELATPEPSSRNGHHADDSDASNPVVGRQ